MPNTHTTDQPPTSLITIQDGSSSFPRLYRCLDHIMLLRPTVLMPVWTMTLLGGYQAADRPFFWVDLPGTLGWTLLFYSMIMGSVYIVNQLADAETDAANDKLYLLAQGLVQRRTAIIEAILLAVAGYSFAWWLVAKSSEYSWLLGVSGILGFLYSVRPIRLKGKPFLDLLANSVGYGGIAYVVGWTSVADLDAQALRFAVPYILSVGAAFVHSTLLDREGDVLGGDRTTGVVLGVRASCILSFLLIVGGVATSLWSGNVISLIANLCSAPLYGYTVFRRSLETIGLVMRISVAFLTLITAVLMPYYFGALLVVLFAVRWYYRSRFSLRYPF